MYPTKMMILFINIIDNILPKKKVLMPNKFYQLDSEEK